MRSRFEDERSLDLDLRERAIVDPNRHVLFAVGADDHQSRYARFQKLPASAGLGAALFIGREVLCLFEPRVRRRELPEAFVAVGKVQEGAHGSLGREALAKQLGGLDDFPELNELSALVEQTLRFVMIGERDSATQKEQRRERECAHDPARSRGGHTDPPSSPRRWSLGQQRELSSRRATRSPSPDVHGRYGETYRLLRHRGRS
jgi:hypothetical protein